MAYNAFTLSELKRAFGLSIVERPGAFASIPPMPVSDLLTQTLEENIPLAVGSGTEKARSEMIIAPVLIEVWRQMNKQVGLLSGVDFTVDATRGLNGICDFLFSLSPETIVVTAPVVAIVEAKNDNLKSGIAQCIAEMVAAEAFNQNALPRVFGTVTTGSNWLFLQLEKTTVTVDLREYFIDHVEKVVGILVHMLTTARAL